MTTNNRPLSPHLQAYKLPITGLISITHRITGVFLSLGLFGFSALLLALALGGETCYNATQALLSTWYGQIVLWGFLYALYFHLCHGIRHLIWDIGRTFDRATFNRYAVIELVFSILLLVLTFLYLSFLS